MAIKLGQLIIELTAKADAFTKGMGDARKLAFTSAGDIVNSVERIGASLAKLKFENAAQIERSFKLVGGVAAGVAAGLAGAFALVVEKSVTSAAKLYDLAQATGVSVQELSALGYVAKLQHIELETLSKGLERLSRNILTVAQGAGGVAAKAFQQLGVSSVDVKKALAGDLDAVLGKIADRFATMPNGALKTGLAMEIFGRSGAALIPMLNLGAAGIAKLKEEAADLGLVLDDQTAKAAKQTEEEMIRVKSAIDGAGLQITAGFLPAIGNLLTSLTHVENHSSAMREFGKNVGDVLTGIAKKFLEAAYGADFMILKTEEAINFWKGVSDYAKEHPFKFATGIGGGEMADAGMAKVGSTDAALNELTKRFAEAMNKLDAAFKTSILGNGGGKTGIDDVAGSAKGLSKVLQELTNISSTLRVTATDPLTKALDNYRTTLAKIDEAEAKIPPKLRNTAQGQLAAAEAENDRRLALAALNRELDNLADEGRAKILKEISESTRLDLSALPQIQAPVMPALSGAPDFTAELRKQSIAWTDLASSTERYAAVVGNLNIEESRLIQGMHASGATAAQIASVEERFTIARQKATLAAIEQKVAERNLTIEIQRANDALLMSTRTATAGALVALREYMRESNDMAQNVHDAMRSTLSGMQNAFSTFFTDVAMGTKSIGQAFAELGMNILNAIVSSLAQMLAQWIVTHIAMMIFSILTAKTSAKATASSTKAQVSAAAGLAGANAVASWSLAPWPIDMLAPVFGAAMFAAAQSFGVLGQMTAMGVGGEGFAEGGVVPGSGTGDIVPAMLTPGEGVLTTAQMAMLQSSSSAATAAAMQQPPASSTTIVLAPTVNAIDQQGVQEFFDSYLPELAVALRQAANEGRLSTNGAGA